MCGIVKNQSEEAPSEIIGEREKLFFEAGDVEEWKWLEVDLIPVDIGKVVENFWWWFGVRRKPA